MILCTLYKPPVWLWIHVRAHSLSLATQVFDVQYDSCVSSFACQSWQRSQMLVYLLGQGDDMLHQPVKKCDVNTNQAHTVLEWKWRSVGWNAVNKVPNNKLAITGHGSKWHQCCGNCVYVLLLSNNKHINTITEEECIFYDSLLEHKGNNLIFDAIHKFIKLSLWLTDFSEILFSASHQPPCEQQS